MPVMAVRTALPGRFAACIAQESDSPVGLWCIGHMAPAPWPHVHSTPWGSAATIHSANGARAIVPTWQEIQIAVTGASTRRSCDIKETIAPEHGPVKGLCRQAQAYRCALAERTALGGRLTYRRLGHFFDRHTESALGIQLRRDWLDPVGLYPTQARQRRSTTREDEVGQTMTGLYAQTETGPSQPADRDRVGQLRAALPYFYASRLPNEPEPVEDIHLHPALPFTVRAGVQFSF